ncbi:MAG: alpha/beta hydrolase, partial [Pseudomonadota bacterium]
MADYAPGHFIDLVSPKPLYIAAATEDVLCPLAITERHFKRAGEPKRLDLFEGGHFDFFPPSGTLFEPAVSAMLAWYEETL